MSTSSESTSIKGLFSQLTSGLTDLIRNEARLVRAELEEKVDTATQSLISVIGGLFIALAALVILLEALVVALSDWLDPAWAALIVGAVAAVIALILVIGGAKGLKRSARLPQETLSEAKRDRDMVKEHMK